MTASVKVLSSNEAAALIGVTRGTLKFWRHKGKGPRYVKLGEATREWNEKVQPLTAKKVRAMKEAADLLNGRVKILKKAHTDAVGTHDEFKEDRQGRRILAKRWTPEEVREMVRKANLAFEVPVAR